MSFGGGGGTQGSIRYALIVDDAQATQKLNTFKTSLTSLGTPTANLNKNLAQMGTTLKSTSTSVTQMGTSLKSTGAGLTQTTTQVNQLGAAQKNFNATTVTTGKNVATMGNNFKATVTQIKSAGPPLANLQKTTVSLGSKIKDNVSKFSGLATGMSATASGALQLAAGFRDYSDAQIAVDRVTRKNSLAQEALGKAQAKLNALQKSGKASAAELAAARLDVSQADAQAKIQVQLLGEAQERMFDSQSQFVVSVIPTVLGAVGTLGSAFKDFGGSLGKLTGAFKQGGAAAKLFSSDLGMIGIGAAAGIGAALLIVQQVEAANARLDAVGIKFHKLSAGFLSSSEDLKQSQEELDLIIAKTGRSLSQIQFDAEGTKKAWVDAGGALDEAGNIIFDTTTKVSDLGVGFKATSDQYAVWAAQMQKDQGRQAVVKWLTESNIKLSDQAKILEKVDKILKQVTPATVDYNRALDYQLGRLPKVSSAADEYGFNIDEIVANSILATEAIENSNRAIDYQEAFLNKVTSAADEYANNIDETAASNIIAADEIANFNRALDYQLDRLPQVSSAADEYAFNIDETAAQNILAAEAIENSNRALDYQEAAFPTSQIEEYAKGVNEADGETKSLAETIDHTTPLLDAMAKAAKDAADKALKAWQDFAKESRTQLFTTFDVKTPEDQKKKFLDKIRKSLPDKVEKKIDLILKAQAKEEGFKAGAAALISGLAEEIKGDEKLADAVVKSIASKAPKGELKDWLKSILDDPNTGDIVVENIQKSADGQTITVPAETDFSNDPLFNPHGAGGFEMDLGGSSMKPVIVPAEAHVDQAIIGNGVDPVQTAIDAKTYTAKISRVAYTRDYNPDTGITSYGGGPDEETKGMELDIPLADVQTLQKAFDSLAKYATKNLEAIGKSAKTNFNSVANYANGATTFLQTNQKATDSLAKYGAKNMQSLGKAAKTNFNSVANYADGATSHSQTLQKALESLGKYGVKNMQALAKGAKTNFNTVANYANGATTAVKKLQSAINALKDKTVTVTYKRVGSQIQQAQHGMHATLGADTLIQAHKGERVDIGPESGGRTRSRGAGGAGGAGEIVINLTNVNFDRETTRTFRREMGKELYRFGPT
jgi:hypothetical protein